MMPETPRGGQVAELGRAGPPAPHPAGGTSSEAVTGGGQASGQFRPRARSGRPVPAVSVEA